MLYSGKGLTADQLLIRDLAMSDLRAFVGLVAKNRVLGHCHHDLMQYLMRDDSHQLILWPRAHQKSTMIAYWCVWWLINHPADCILYCSATSGLAEKQLGFMKRILQSKIVQTFWPELMNGKEKSDLWRNDEIEVDHFLRYEYGVRDPSIKSVGIGSNATGFHANVVILDDLVVDKNAKTKTARDEVKDWASYLVSILEPGDIVRAVGTRYHEDDLYGAMLEMVEDVFDAEGEVIGQRPIYTSSCRVVEEEGQFLWPRQRGPTGKFYGFDKPTLARIKAQYFNKANFYSQYYNNPTDPENQYITKFEYYDREQLQRWGGKWHLGKRRLNIFAAIDFAATISKRSDFTAIVVIGVDDDHNIYILDIDRFKTEHISEMTDRLNAMYNKWDWLKLRAETNAQQNLIAEQIKENNRRAGIYYAIDKQNQVLDKPMRIMANLEPRYAEGKIYHYRGGNCQILEDELMASNPQHDDVADALASAMEIIRYPRKNVEEVQESNVIFHPRFGGVH